MAKSSSPIKNVTRVFDRLENPVYILDPTGIVLYANEACAAWIGLNHDVVLSKRCIYSTEALNNNVERQLQGLCPPQVGSPSQGQQAQNEFYAFVDRQGKKEWRRCTTSKLYDNQDEYFALMVVAELELLSKPPEPRSPSQISSEYLHATLQEIQAGIDQKYSFESLVGTSPYSGHIRRVASTAVGSNANFVISGPPGSGKEHLARSIHLAIRSKFGESELLPVHCSIADQNLIQQNIKEVVGTQSASQSNNKPESKDWLLLLNVDRLGEAAQNELLGFFQLPDFNLSAIATSTRPLMDLANQGLFSKELALWLSTMNIDLVALRDRKEDVPLLAQSLAEQNNSKGEIQIIGFSDEVLNMFIEFEWPENVDQLNRIVQASISGASGSQITAADLPDEFSQALKAQRIGSTHETTILLDEFLGDIEKQLITRAMRQAKGNKTKAAKLLGISRGKLLRRFQQLGLGQDSDNEESLQVDESVFHELDEIEENE